MTKASRSFLDAGVKLASQGLIPSAISYFLQYLQSDPESSDALLNLGEAFRRQCEYERSRQCLIESLRLSPFNVLALYNLGVLLQETEDLDEAILIYKKITNLYPDHRSAIFNLAKCYKDSGNLTKSLECYQYLYQVGERAPQLLWNYSLLKMKIGDYRHGLALYEHRFFENSSVRPVIEPPMPRLQSLKEADLHGLLIVAEQGLGDTIQFIRYCKQLCDLIQLPVEICVPDSLLVLFEESIKQLSFVPVSQVINSGFDHYSGWYWVPMLSLPYLLSIDPILSSSSFKYLEVNRKLAKEWRSIIHSEPGLKIGLAWQGNPSTEKSNLRGRSIPLSAFKPLACMDAVKLVSLQHGYGVEQLDQCGFIERFVTYKNSPVFVDEFTQVLAVMSNCHLVVTCDTVVAHLAGAAGLAVYLLLHANCDWRWGSDSSSTFWYENVTIFRQSISGQWTDVVRAVEKAMRRDLNLVTDVIVG